MSVSISDFTAQGVTDRHVQLTFNGEAIQRKLAVGKDWLSLRFVVRLGVVSPTSFPTCNQLTGSTGTLFIGMATELDCAKSAYVGRVGSKHLGCQVLSSAPGYGKNAASTYFGKIFYNANTTTVPVYMDGSTHSWPTALGTGYFVHQDILPSETVGQTYTNVTSVVMFDLVTSKPSGSLRRFLSGGLYGAAYGARDTVKPVTAAQFGSVVEEARKGGTLASLGTFIGTLNGGAAYTGEVKAAAGAPDIDEGADGFNVFEVSWGVAAAYNLHVADVAVIKLS
jgi:hypothetical protein